MLFKNFVGYSCLVLIIVICSVQCAPSNSTDTMMAAKDKASSSSSSTTTTKAPAASSSSSTVVPKDGSKNATSNGSGEDCEPEAEPENSAGSKNKTEGAAAGKGREGKQLNLGDKKDSYGAAPEPEPETKATAGKANNAQPGATPEKLSANNASTTPAPASGGSSAITAPTAILCLTAFTAAFFVSAAAL